MTLAKRTLSVVVIVGITAALLAYVSLLALAVVVVAVPVFLMRWAIYEWEDS